MCDSCVLVLLAVKPNAHTSEIIRSRFDCQASGIVRDESPWDTFELDFSCKLAGTVAIAAHRSRPSRVIAIREYSAGDVEKMLQRFRHIQHENIMCSSECYRHNCSLYAVVDDLPLTLEHLGSRTVCPNEVQLGSIMRQVS